MIDFLKETIVITPAELLTYLLLSVGLGTILVVFIWHKLNFKLWYDVKTGQSKYCFLRATASLMEDTDVWCFNLPTIFDRSTQEYLSNHHIQFEQFVEHWPEFENKHTKTFFPVNETGIEDKSFRHRSRTHSCYLSINKRRIIEEIPVKLKFSLFNGYSGWHLKKS